MFKIGDIVVLKHDPSRKGTINAESFISGNIVFYPVKISNKVTSLPEAEGSVFSSNFDARI